MSRKLGGYLLGEAVEEDTHTLTYRGEKEGDDRPLLVKALKPGLRPSRRLRRELEAERAFLLKLSHPGLPIVLGRLRSKQSMALLLVDRGGRRLAQVLRQAVLIDPAAAAAVALAVAEVLAVAHRHGVVHGHLKPESVEVTAGGQLIVHGLRPRPDAPQDPLESPDQLTPEQLLGEAPEPQTDIFLVGVLLYRMLAGRGPFEGDARSEDGLGQRVRNTTPRPLPERSPPLSEGLQKIVMRCLSKRPADRFADMASLISALESDLRSWNALPRDVLIARVLSDAGLAEALPLPAEHRSSPPLGRAFRQWRRPLSILAVIIALLAAGGLLWRGLRSNPTAGPNGPRGIVERPAYVRVLAQPWAEVLIDGKPADVTPVANPFEVAPGRHTFLFRHPNAPDETRTIEVIAGQTVLLDVQMQVVRPEPSASAAPSGEAASP